MQFPLASSITSALSLQQVCTRSHVQQSLPSSSDLLGLVPLPESVTTESVYNATASGSPNYPDTSGLNFCNITFSYTHNGLDDSVNLWFLLPEPASFQNRFLATGGDGEMINKGLPGLLQGAVYGAASGITDGGFSGFNTQLTDVVLRANGTVNYEAVYAFAYKAMHEMTIIGQHLTKSFYNTSKIYSYYSGCSEGGREGWSQMQIYGSQFDGAVVGAPAFNQAYQQLNHLTSPLVQRAHDYAPLPCELEKINNDTIAACDLLDGREDGVVSRSDLCKLSYDQSASIGSHYYCPPSSESSSEPLLFTAPAANGTVSAKAVAIAKDILAGLHDSRGRQVYISYQPGAKFNDAQTAYNASSGEYYTKELKIAVQWVKKFLQHTDSKTMSLDGVTADTVRSWIMESIQKYQGTLQTIWPDLEVFRASGAKVIHYHGEADHSVPTGASVLYQDSVRKTMYPGLTYNESFAQLGEWYRLFLVPGAGHCGPSSQQPNGLYPQSMLEQLIRWVERGEPPERLRGTVLKGPRAGETGHVCLFPLRPRWASDSSEMECVYDQRALDTWFPHLTSIPISAF